MLSLKVNITGVTIGLGRLDGGSLHDIHLADFFDGNIAQQDGVVKFVDRVEEQLLGEPVEIDMDRSDPRVFFMVDVIADVLVQENYFQPVVKESEPGRTFF